MTISFLVATLPPMAILHLTITLHLRVCSSETSSSAALILATYLQLLNLQQLRNQNRAVSSFLAGDTDVVAAKEASFDVSLADESTFPGEEFSYPLLIMVSFLEANPD